MSEFAEQQKVPEFVTFDHRVTEAPEGALEEIIRRGDYPENQYDFNRVHGIMMFGVWPFVVALERGHVTEESNGAAFKGLYFAQLVADYLSGDRVELPYPHDATIDSDERRARLLAARDDYLHANPNMAGWIQRFTAEWGNFSPWGALVFETVATSMLQATEDAERQKFMDLESKFGYTDPPPETTG